MSSVAEVKLWGRSIGAVSLADGADVTAFEYDAEFTQSGIEISPLKMPLSRRIYSFPELANVSFHGLPGLLADSLPDKFGNALIDAWLAQQGRSPASFNAVERLCYIGRRGMGALEFAPVLGPDFSQSRQVEVGRLVDLASAILANRDQFKTCLADGKEEQALTEILQVGTSAGGARAKAVIVWNPVTNEVRSGQLPADSGFEHWLIKFDGVAGNRDKELADPKGYGVIEYAYYRMARDAGISMNKCRLFEENGRRHFMTRRFDRTPAGKKRHMQTLAALAHYDFNMAGAYSYEQALLAMRQLALPVEDVEEQFRRMVFNVMARNQDDHVKNIAFLMDQAGQWSLAPAYDTTYSFNPSGDWTGQHQMTINDKRDNFTLEDFKACAGVATMKRGRAEKIVKEVCDAVADWRRHATDLDIPPERISGIEQTLRVNDFK